MFIEEKMKVRATDDDNKIYTGSVYRIVIQLCEDDNNRPHALIFVSQDKDYIKQDGEFGCASLWVDKLKSIEVLQIENSENQIQAIAIDADSADPLHSQVYSNIKELIVRGELKSDDILPTISSLSKRLRICEGTVKIAYRNLEKDGYIYTGLYKRKYVN